MANDVLVWIEQSDGTADSIVPYDGGMIKVNLFPRLAKYLRKPNRGRVISTERTIELWVQHNAITAAPLTITGKRTPGRADLRENFASSAEILFSFAMVSICCCISERSCSVIPLSESISGSSVFASDIAHPPVLR